MEIDIGTRQLSLIRGDITGQSTDAIVNAANSSLIGGGGVDGAIHRAGGPAILAECKQIVARHGRLPAGQAVITTGGSLQARYVIHTVGSVWRGGKRRETATLVSSYQESLELAENNGINTICFPSISTGAYGYPVEQAAEVALKTVASFLREKAGSVNEVVFVLFNERTYEAYERAATSLT